jgi:hypothetical protein
MRCGWLVLGMVMLGGGGGLAGCRNASKPLAERDPNAPLVLLQGTFESVAKPAQGRAEIVRTGERYELHLHGARVESQRPVRVYLVGVARAPTTRSVIDAELKYDMAELDQGATHQVIALPSAPDPAIRTVVMWEPTFYVNLAFASLAPPAPSAAPE